MQVDLAANSVTWLVDLSGPAQSQFGAAVSLSANGLLLAVGAPTDAGNRVCISFPYASLRAFVLLLAVGSPTDAGTLSVCLLVCFCPFACCWGTDRCG